MALIWGSAPSQFLHKTPHSICFPSSIPSSLLRSVSVRATGTEGGSRVSGQQDPSFLRRPLVSSPVPILDSNGADEVEKEGGEGQRKKPKRAKAKAADEWVDWEDQILEDTVPLVGFVRMILHSGKYECGDRLTPEHEKAVIERLLPYHPESEKKIGSGIDYIAVGLHPEFENSRCLFIARKDGQLEDFSYWKCIKGLIKKKYPLYADSFILRHFKRNRQVER